jgi:sarcosine oxidase subunit alpha
MSERVHFTLDGAAVEAEAGITVLAAAWNLGRRTLRTSVSGSARGALCVMGTCFECRVTLDGRPGRRACLELVRPGLDVRTGDVS